MGGFIDMIMGQLVDWVAQFVLSSLGALVAVMDRTAFFVPDVTLIPQVQYVWAANQAIANTCYVLAIVVAGVYVMSRDSFQARYGVKELAPRLVFGAVAGNFSLQWCSLIFGWADALVRAIAGQPLIGGGALTVVRDQVNQDLRSPASLLLVLLGVLILALVVGLLFTWVVRFGILIVAVAASPLALACYCLPMLDGVARLWWRTVIGALGTQLLQALTITTGVRVFLDPASSIPAQVGIDGGPILNLIVLCVLLWAAVKIPSLMGRYVTRSNSTDVASAVLRVVVMQQVARRTGTTRLLGPGAR